MITLVLFAILVALPGVYAGGWNDFSNNLATDLAPFLSLFGEQITKQYLSESVTNLDYFIFAMAPMGILTGVVSAIRVCGTPSLRAFIGRAQEGAGNAEAELCTSTSRDVCELYNSGGIARVFGRPKILEVVHDPDYVFGNSDDTAGIYTFQDFVKRGKGQELWQKKLPKKLDTEAAEKSDIPSTTFAPNLSLNIGIKKQPTAFFKVIGLTGLVLQLGVLVFAGIVTYYLKWGNDGKPPESYACPLVMIGTVFLCGGMFHCASLVGRSTDEDVWDRQKTDTDRTSMYWVQPGGQIIGDQTFDAFSHTDSKNRLKKYMTSTRKSGSQEPSYEIWVAIATTITGFVLQFTGLRGIHSAVSVAQLGIILVMSIARAMLRVQRLTPNDNCFANFLDEVVGHELDWLALRIRCDVIEKDIKKNRDSLLSGSLSSTSFNKLSSFSETADVPSRHFWRLYGAPDKNKINLEHPSPNDRNAAVMILAYRTRLASLTDSSAVSTAPAREFKSEMVEVRSASRQLATLIEATMKAIFYNAKIKAPWKAKIQEESSSVFWGIDCDISEPTLRSPQKQRIYLEFTRQDPVSPTSPWILKNKLELEGILGLWVWSLKSDPDIEIKDPLTRLTKSTAADIQARRIGPTDQVIKPDLKIWLGDDINEIAQYSVLSRPKPNGIVDVSTVWIRMGATKADVEPIRNLAVVPSKAPRLRFFGWKDQNLRQSELPLNIWSAAIEGSLVAPCAQEIFVSFLTSILDIVEDVGPVDIQTEPLRLENTLVTEMVKLFTETRVGSRQEALVCIVPLVIPHLHVHSKASALAAAKRSANQQRQTNEWSKAEETLRWAWNICTRTQHSCTDATEQTEDHKLAEEATIALGELFRWALMDETKKSIGNTGISWLKEKKSSRSISACNATCEVIDRYVDIANQLPQPDFSITDFLAAMRDRRLNEALRFITHAASRMSNEKKGEALCLAARNGWTEVALLLVELTREPDFRDLQSDRTPLSYAAEVGSVTIVTELIRWGSFPNSEDSARRTPLSWAAAAGSFEVSDLLLKDIRVSPDQADNQNRTPLLWAARNRHEAVVKLLLESDKVDPNAQDEVGRTPLSWAANHGCEGIVKLLLDTDGVDPNLRDNIKRTPLSWATNKGHAVVVQRLLNIDKIDPNAKEKNEETPLSLAVHEGYETIVNMLLDDDRVDPNQIDRNNRTPLSWAAYKGHETIMNMLLEDDRVDPAQMDGYERTPLSWAAQCGHAVIVNRLLEDNRVNPDQIDEDGLTPLWWAVQFGRESIVKRLLEDDRVTPDLIDKKGQTPLLWAAQRGTQRGHEVIVNQLLEDDRVNPNHMDKDKRTPLWWAVYHGRESIVKRLLEDDRFTPDLMDKTGQTPLLLAKARGYASLESMLEEAVLKKRGLAC